MKPGLDSLTKLGKIKQKTRKTGTWDQDELDHDVRDTGNRQPDRGKQTQHKHTRVIRESGPDDTQEAKLYTLNTGRGTVKVKQETLIHTTWHRRREGRTEELDELGRQREETHMMHWENVQEAQYRQRTHDLRDMHRGQTYTGNRDEAINSNLTNPYWQ